MLSVSGGPISAIRGKHTVVIVIVIVAVSHRAHIYRSR